MFDRKWSAFRHRQQYQFRSWPQRRAGNKSNYLMEKKRFGRRRSERFSIGGRSIRPGSGRPRFIFAVLNVATDYHPVAGRTRRTLIPSVLLRCPLTDPLRSHPPLALAIFHGENSATLPVPIPIPRLYCFVSALEHGFPAEFTGDELTFAISAFHGKEFDNAGQPRHTRIVFAFCSPSSGRLISWRKPPFSS